MKELVEYFLRAILVQLLVNVAIVLAQFAWLKAMVMTANYNFGVELAILAEVQALLRKQLLAYRLPQVVK